ncbi:uncharacterized protein LOC124275797 isoform X3 [Haliotis rubra]|uniref:uncharacterized protein LOC124275797 isoform X3 n=1 Tax=Haliotis rubra TaxID=36100 RepID=UPI001EE62D2B|nr:uncharacterized protein LOC124275797 isoform X3 [Haliotis rubra]
MSEDILEQKERLSDKKTPVKDTCREVKIFLQQITNLSGDKLQSLSEEAKLKLDSLIKNFRKMTASTWKLIFCVLLLYELRDMFDSLQCESYSISLNRGRLKYAFKMASMLALWLSHDVETNPGPQFNDRTCIETLVRRLSESLRDNLKIGESIWSKDVANAAYSAGFSRKCKWNNPSGKGKDSFPELIARAIELGRVLTVKNCLPPDLATFMVNLDQQETRDRLRQYLKVENYKTAVDVLLYEDFTTQTAGTIRHLTQILQEKISSSGRTTYGPEARTPTPTIINSEFIKLADPQCTDNAVSYSATGISDIVTRYSKKKRQGKNNKMPHAKQFIEVVHSEPHTADRLTCDAMFSGSMMEKKGVETGESSKELASSTNTFQQDEDFRSSTNSLPAQSPSTVTLQKDAVDYLGLTNSLCTQSTSTATFQGDEDCRGSTSSLPLQSRITVTLHNDDDDRRALTNTLCTQPSSTATFQQVDGCSSSDNSLCTQSTSTDTLQADCCEERITEEKREFVRMTLETIRDMEMKATPTTQGIDSPQTSEAEHDMTSECGINNGPEVSSQDEQSNADLESLFDCNSVEVAGPKHTRAILEANLPENVSETTLWELFESGPIHFMQAGDVNPPSSNTPYADAKTQGAPAAGDTSCGDSTIILPCESFQHQKESEVVSRTIKPSHDIIDTDIWETTTDRGTHVCETSETDTRTSAGAIDSDTRDCNSKTDRDTRECRSVPDADTRDCNSKTDRDTRECRSVPDADTHDFNSKTDRDTRACRSMSEPDNQACGTGTETDTHACEAIETDTRACNDSDRNTAEAKDYITASEFHTVLSSRFDVTNRRLESIERTLQKLISQSCKTQALKPHGDRTLTHEPNDNPGTSPGCSSERRITGNTRRKRKLQHQHLPTKKRRQ